MSVLARGPQTHLREALAIVRQVLTNRSAASGLTTHELFDLAIKQRPSKKIVNDLPPPTLITYRKSGKARRPVPLPPHPEHPIRSLSYVHIL